MVKIRTYSELAEPDASDLAGQVEAQAQRVERQLASVGQVIGVASGKGGVGKSLTAAALAAAATRRGRRVGMLDADMGGPSAPGFLGLADQRLTIGDGGVNPPHTASGIAVMSMALLLDPGAPLDWHGPEQDSFVWRGVRERGALREFLADTIWGELDLLLVDLPPGNSRLVELFELVPRLAGALTVTVPSVASLASVERSMEQASRRGVRSLGIVENMSGYRCGACGDTGPLFPGNAGERLASRFDSPVLARVPFDPDAARLAESGAADEILEVTAAGRAWAEAYDAIEARLAGGSP